MTTTINITSKRKPSRALIMRTLAEYIERGHKDLELLWGENWIEIVKGGSNWFGAGWIKDISGSDIADELNQYARDITNNQFLKDHISFMVIR